MTALASNSDGESVLPTKTQDEGSIGYLTRYAFRAFVKTLSVELEQYDIVTGEWSVLRVLWKGDSLSQVELAQRMRVDKSTLTAVLAKMQRKGLIHRKTHNDDGRKINITLTAKGNGLRHKLLPLTEKINQRATRGLSEAEIRQIALLLDKVTKNLDGNGS